MARNAAKPNRDVFRKNLSNMIYERDVTQKDVADHIGVTQTAVSHWLTGMTTPRGDTLIKLANYFGTTPSVLMGNASALSTIDEERILHLFRMLSPLGKEKALERMDELTKLYWYGDVAKGS